MQNFKDEKDTLQNEDTISKLGNNVQQFWHFEKSLHIENIINNSCQKNK